jgi:hypothetical protein
MTPPFYLPLPIPTCFQNYPFTFELREGDGYTHEIEMALFE